MDPNQLFSVNPISHKKYFGRSLGPQGPQGQALNRAVATKSISSQGLGLRDRVISYWKREDEVQKMFGVKSERHFQVKFKITKTGVSQVCWEKFGNFWFLHERDP